MKIESKEESQNKNKEEAIKKNDHNYLGEKSVAKATVLRGLPSIGSYPNIEGLWDF